MKLTLEALEDRYCLSSGSLSVAQNITNSNEAFADTVKTDYQYFLGRDADTAGLDFWVKQLTNGWTQEKVEAGFAGSSEYIQAKGNTQAGWIKGLYSDLLGRAPSDTEVNGWLAALHAGVKPFDLALGFTTSRERESIIVGDYYQTFLGRNAGNDEITGWVNQILNGSYREDIQAQFLASTEYYEGHGNTNTSWITAAFNDILQGDPSTQEIQYFEGLLQTHTLDVAQGIANLDENFANLVQADYHAYLGRDGDDVGLNSWVQRMHNGMTQEQVEAAFLASSEYMQLQGGTQSGWIKGLYRDVLGRTPSSDEVNGWLRTLATGTRPIDLALGFTASSERESIVVADYYTSFLGRTASADEISYWVGQIQHGQFREDVEGSFVASQEYYLKHGDNNEVWIGHVYNDILLRDPTGDEVQQALAALS